ncbi:T9SS type A sorting domain-containing protein [Sinomicrobium sp. M5D2P9]
MEKHLLLTVRGILIFLLSIHTGNSQQNSPDCERTLEVAQDYLSQFNHLRESLVEQIGKSVANCYSDNPASYYVRGMLALHQAPGTNPDHAFTDIKTAASQGHKNAAYILATLYKDGIGCVQDFSQALYWFEQAANLGSHRGAYGVGYLYMKGLGSVPQNYSKAISWFEKSDYPMARHWLGVCYYFGYGVEKNESRAVEILRNNKILNSHTLVDQIISKKTDSVNKVATTPHINTTLPSRIAQLLKKRPGYETVHDLSSMSGKYTGTFIEYDWSGEHIKRVLPAELLPDEEGYNNGMAYTLTIGEQEIQPEASIKNHTAYLKNAGLKLHRLYTDHPGQKTLNYSLSSISFSEVEIEGIPYVTGSMNSIITEWNEPGPPIFLILQNEEQKKAREASLGQERFIKIYPNPLETETLIQVELEEASAVHIDLYDLSGTRRSVITSHTYQKPGKQLYPFNGATLPPGIYIIRVRVGSHSVSKMVIKK